VIQNSNRARDHLANERTFLAWVRTSVAVVVFGFAIGRFAIALRQLAQIPGPRAQDDGAFGLDGDEFDSRRGGDGGGRTHALSKDTSTAG
jgi:hypothetical protein